MGVEGTTKNQSFYMVSSQKKVILRKDNLAKRNWGKQAVLFFNAQETIQHLFFDCHVARFVWRCVFCL